MRRLPVEGADVTVVYLGTTESAVIVAVEDDGRTVEVETLGGERLRLRLNATGWFVSADRSARLQWTAAEATAPARRTRASPSPIADPVSHQRSCYTLLP